MIAAFVTKGQKFVCRNSKTFIANLEQKHVI